MKIIVLLIFAGLLVSGLFLWAFFWAVKSGQYEDDYGPSVRMLMDDKKMKNGQDSEDTGTGSDQD
jgi:cbb3-type cytochrome oxidase maturation protein